MNWVPELACGVMERCDELAAITSEPGRIDRYYLTSEHRRCSDLLAHWMDAAGMAVWEDAAGNLWGRYAAATDAAPPIRALIMGSHHDSVPNAGRYDGPLGILTALAVVEYLNQKDIRLPFHVDVVAFGDEEGSRFGTTLLGSYPVAGHWQPEWWELADRGGVTLEQAFRDFGLDPARIGSCARDPEELLGYLELHIEQGPVLEHGGHPLGVVTGIAGARRFTVTLEGEVGHAGTVPLALRRDALLGAAEAALVVERVAREQDVMATVGRLNAVPGAVNVIAGEACWSLDLRATDDESRDHALRLIRSESNRLCDQRGLVSSWRETHSAPAVACATSLQSHQSRALEAMGLEPIHLPSGAGHDAMAMARITDVGMFFIRCGGGISHHPDESVMTTDVGLGIEAMVRTLLNLAQSSANPEGS